MTLFTDFLAELKKYFKGDLRFDSASRILYSTDASMYQIEPLGVAIPKTQDDLQSAVELAAKYKIPILPRGAGSSLGGQAIGEALILDCSRYLDSIVEIDSESHTAVVEPGVVLADLNRAVAKLGLMFGPDPASAERATMGGVIGNNATGAHSILYGMTADHLISADVILGDGSLETWNEYGDSKLSRVAENIRLQYADKVKEKFPRSWRNSAGYRLNYLLPWTPSKPPQWDANDYGLSSTVYRQNSKVNLASLLAGSEGTLAVMRRAKINLAQNMHKQQGFLDGEDQKTLITFVLYGDPLLPGVSRVARGARLAKSIQTARPVAMEYEAMDDGSRPETVAEIKSLLARYLPGAHSADVHMARPLVAGGAKGAAPHTHRVYTLAKTVHLNSRETPAFARVTVDKAGKVIKVAVSR